MEVAEGSFEVLNERGMHARAASRLVQAASRFPCEISVARGDQAANAKSVMGVLLLCGSKGTVLDFSARGERAQEALDTIERLFAERFGEEE